MRLTKNVEFILKRLNENGHRADVVGGPVRDFLRGVAPSDYDITTSALPEETKAAFADHRIVDTGIKHGTVSLILDGEPYEITTWRIDGEYKDARHPESVTFTKSIEEDLARRDFTMNAIAYNPRDGLTDPCFGREDIEKRIIRAVRDPYLRFSEDALRILRALRFSATLGYEIEENTAAALRAKSHLLRTISAERIFTEWKKLLSGDFAYEVISNFTEVISVFIPELSELRLPKKECFADDFFTRQAQIFYLSCADPAADYTESMKRLKTDTHTRTLGETVLVNSSKYKLSALSDAGIMLSALGEEAAKATARLDLSLGKIDKNAFSLIEEYLECDMPYRLSDLAVCGDDIKALGISGRAVGEALSSLLEAVISGKTENTHDALLEYIKAQIM